MCLTIFRGWSGNDRAPREDQATTRQTLVDVPIPDRASGRSGRSESGGAEGWEMSKPKTRKKPRYDLYESKKKELDKLILSSDEYDRRILKIAKECGV